MIKRKCEHFAKTGIKLLANHNVEDECRICPLRSKETGDCIKDIMEDKGLEMESEISEIWRKFYEEKSRG